ncbi:nucleoporin 88-like [Littorina saxatilis]|uniref:Nuclear pore complex protein Nup88 n=1 Tax=Littorina saxatilis TaxID=31220 RepID=A0AAN9AIZ0_9CAEN
MAAPTEDWRDKLKVHPICKRLKDAAGNKYPYEVVGEAKSLLSIKNGDLFVWDSYSANIVHCNLKSLLSVSQKESADARFQVLMCTDTPRFDVEGLALNSCGSHLAVWGPRGIRVLELPQRWGKHSEFEGGKDVISCRTVSLATRHLAGSQWVQVRQVTWHPGSPSDTHLAVLTSDNIFSVYNLTEPERPLSSTNLQPGELNSFQASPTKFNISAALGETAVAFTFGPPHELRPVKRPFQIPKSEDAVTVWPVYVVRGNGDVMVTYSEVVSNRPLQLPTQGPLVMYPPAVDNYGVDACSVMCLETSPPVLIVATCDGRIHHCLILPASDSEAKSKELTVSPDLPKYRHPGEPLLYVVESVELELSLTDGNLDPVASELSQDHFTCPIKLIKDPVSTDRYHCCHSAGVHSVALPWVHALHNFLSNEACEFVLPEDQESVVEHLICTKPLYSSPAAPVLGMDIVSDPTLTPTLLVLSMDHDFTALPMSCKYRNPFSGFMRDSSCVEGLSSPLRRIAAEPFSQHIAKILHRSVSNPLLMTNPNTEMSQRECYMLLMRVTQVLREEYVQKQEHAQQETDTRVRILTDQKEQQLLELKSLEQTKNSLRDKAEKIGERLQSCHDNQDDLLRRLEAIMRKIQCRVPLLSMSEKHMHSELLEMKEKTEEFTKNLTQLRAKQEYQQRHMCQPQTVSSPSTHLRQQQVHHIKDILKEEGDQIACLMKQISQLKMETSL